MELCGFCQQDARDVEVGEYHFRGSIEGLIVGALESVALDRAPEVVLAHFHVTRVLLAEAA